MYTCKDPVCDPVCDFCWYCINDEIGAPVECEKGNPDFLDGMGYCDDFRCCLHEEKPADKKQIRAKETAQVYFLQFLP